MPTTSAFPYVTAVHTLRFDNRFVNELPGDPDRSNRRRQVLGAAWSAAAPTPVGDPALVAHAHEVAALVGIAEQEVRSPAFARVFEPHAGAREFQNAGIDQRVVDDAVGLAQGMQTVQGQQARIARTSPHQPNSARFENRHVETQIIHWHQSIRLARAMLPY